MHRLIRIWFLRISNLKQGIIFYLVGFVFGLILRQGNLSSNGWFIILSILWKKSKPELAWKNYKVLRVLRIRYLLYQRAPQKKIVLRWNEYFQLFPYGTKSRENNGPNGQPAQCMTPSEFYKIRYIQRYCIGKHLI